MFLLVLGVFLGCKAQDNSTFVQNDLLQHVQILSSDEYEGRRTGTKGSMLSRAYLVKQFDVLGLEALTDDYRQPFEFDFREKTYEAVNIIGLIKGRKFPEKYIVITAHYDHLGIRDGKIFNGADDNASGTAGLLGFAQYFKNNRPDHSVILAALDAEELGLRGATFFVKSDLISKEDIVININMDMIGRSLKKELYVVGTRFYPQFEPFIQLNETRGLLLKVGHDGSDGKQNWTNSSDHAAFHRAEIPFLYFGVEDHEDYHRETDEYEGIDPNFIASALNTIISVFENIDKDE